MALTYRLIITKKVKKEQIDVIINSSKIDSLHILSYARENTYIDAFFKDNLIEREYSETTNISFRFGNYENEDQYIQIKKEMMRLVYNIINIIDEDFYFNFNSDLIHLKRENGKLEKDETSDFWKHL